MRRLLDGGGWKELPRLSAFSVHRSQCTCSEVGCSFREDGLRAVMWVRVGSWQKL